MGISDFFKDPVAIATLVLAFVTTVLALGTFFTIRQNSKFREKDRKERILGEIIEWSEEIMKCGLNNNFSDFKNITARYSEAVRVKNLGIKKADYLREMLNSYNISLVELIFECAKTKRTQFYIKNISSTMGSSLYNSVTQLIDFFSNHLELIQQCYNTRSTNLEKIVIKIMDEDKRGVRETDESVDKIGESKKKLDTFAKNVIEEATKEKVALIIK
jgi:hypothetical protein